MIVTGKQVGPPIEVDIDLNELMYALQHKDVPFERIFAEAKSKYAATRGLANCEVREDGNWWHILTMNGRPVADATPEDIAMYGLFDEVMQLFLKIKMNGDV